MASVTPEFDFQIYNLSPDFYLTYPNSTYPEILWNRGGRAYNCLLIETKSDYLICIPYRSNVHHRYAFHFRNSVRSAHTPSALDYRKMVIIKDLRYLDLLIRPIIDSDEYVETIQNMQRISREANEFLEDYISYVAGTPTISPEEYNRRYSKSPLQYFHDELGIS